MIRVVIDLPDDATSHDFECAASAAWTMTRVFPLTSTSRERRIGAWSCMRGRDGSVRVVHARPRKGNKAATAKGEADE